MKDTTHMLNILHSFRFSNDGGQRLVFTMDIKSLYTVIPNDEGLVSLKYFLDKREVKDPPTDTLVRITELVLTLNTFEFKGEYYKQAGGVAMGSRLGPNYACLFVGYVKERMLAENTGSKLDCIRDTWTTERPQPWAVNKTYSSFLILLRSTILSLSTRGLSHLKNSRSWTLYDTP